MSWELFEVWGVDEDDHETLIDTSGSLKQAQGQVAVALEIEGYVEVIIYQDIDGELREVRRFSS